MTLPLLLLAAAMHRGPSTETRVLDAGGQHRRYLLHVPPDAAGKLPLVLAFHGGSQTPEEMERMTGFDAVADREHFLVAYPEGIDRSWADGRGTTVADTKGIDDVEFTRRVIADIRAHHDVDPRRIYATGPSNGGIFSNLLGCTMANVFAAVGPVIGTVASKVAPNCKPSQPIAVIGIQGVADPLMPFAGGEEGGQRHLGHGGRIESSRATQAMWASLDGCKAEPSVERLPVRVQDGTSVVKRSYGACRGGADVVWYEVEGGGHRWPGREARPALEPLAGRILGVASANLDATETIWAFFAAHQR